MNVSGFSAHDSTAHVATLDTERARHRRGDSVLVDLHEDRRRDAMRDVDCPSIASRESVDTLGDDDFHVDDARALLNIDPFIEEISQRH